MGRFYVLGKYAHIGSADTDYLDSDDSQTGPAPTCPQCGNYTGMLRWLPPFRVELECWGTEFGDMAFGPGESILVSQRFVTLYQRAGLTGLEGFEPVEILKVKRHRHIRGDPPPYHQVVVRRTRAAVDQIASGFVWERGAPTCPECRGGRTESYFEQLVIEDGTWSGEDIFIPRGMFVYVASERFKQFCENHEIRNAVLRPAETHWGVLMCWRTVEEGNTAKWILAQPVGGDILEKVMPDGDILRIDKGSNNVVIIVKEDDGTLRIKAIFRPRDVMAFWNRH